MKTNIELCGMKIRISAQFVDFDKPQWDDNEWHPHFRISVRANNRSHTFDYWGSVMDYRNNKQEMDEFELLDAFSCLFADASWYDCNQDFMDFCAAGGYEKMSDYEDAKRAYRECKKANIACKRLFGRYYGTIHNKLEEHMSNIYETLS